jgi:hypothetical protein
MMNSSRPVTDAKLAVFEELIARTLCHPMRYWTRTGIALLEETSLVMRRFKDFGTPQDARGGVTFVPWNAHLDAARFGVAPGRLACELSQIDVRYRG